MKPILKINETEEEEINESENVQQKINVVKPITEIKIFSSVEEFNDYYAIGCPKVRLAQRSI